MMNLFKRLVKKNSLFNDISDLDYINIDDYISELDDVKSELEDVECTIRYYTSRRNVLNDWKHSLEINIAKWNEDDVCRNCKYYSKLYCSKFESTVNEDASCDSFEWKEDDLDFS